MPELEPHAVALVAEGVWEGAAPQLPYAELRASHSQADLRGQSRGTLAFPVARHL